MSLAGVSLASVTIADMDLRSVEPGPDGGRERTPSTVRVGGIRLLITACDVPGGSEDRCSVGFGAARSAALLPAAFSSSSSDVWNAVAASSGPGASPNASRPCSMSLCWGCDPSNALLRDNEGGGPKLPGPLLPRGPVGAPKCRFPAPPKLPLPGPGPPKSSGLELGRELEGVSLSMSKDFAKS